MGLFDIFTRAWAVPGWASHLDIAAYRAFEDRVHGALQDLGHPVNRRQIRQGSFRVGDGGVNLHNLVREIDPDIEEFCRRLIESPDQELYDRAITDWECAKPLLRVQWVTADSSSVAMEGAQPVAEGLVQILTLDLPHTVPFVQLDKVDWGVSAETLHQVGLENVQQTLGATPIEPLELDALVLHELVTDTYSTPVLAYSLEERLGPCEHGFLLLFPSSHQLLAYPIRDAEVSEALRLLPILAPRVMANMPRPLTNQVYWLHGDKLVHVPPVDLAEPFGSEVVTLGNPGALPRQLPPDLAAIVESLTAS